MASSERTNTIDSDDLNQSITENSVCHSNDINQIGMNDDTKHSSIEINSVTEVERRVSSDDVMQKARVDTTMANHVDEASSSSSTNRNGTNKNSNNNGSGDDNHGAVNHRGIAEGTNNIISDKDQGHTVMSGMDTSTIHENGSHASEQKPENGYGDEPPKGSDTSRKMFQW